LDRIFGKGSEFRAHLNRSRIELLKAIRALVDKGIDHLEKQNTDAADQKMTRIEVE